MLYLQKLCEGLRNTPKTPPAINRVETQVSPDPPLAENLTALQFSVSSPSAHCLIESPGCVRGSAFRILCRLRIQPSYVSSGGSSISLKTERLNVISEATGTVAERDMANHPEYSCYGLLITTYRTRVGATIRLYFVTTIVYTFNFCNGLAPTPPLASTTGTLFITSSLYREQKAPCSRS